MILFIKPCVRKGIGRTVIRTFAITLVAILVAANGSAQRSEPFLFDCVSPGQPLNIDADVVAPHPATYYHWQFKTPSGVWTCFVNGTNSINGASFGVSGALKNGGANDAPLLVIENASNALENVLVRLLMATGADPCMISSPVWGGDDQAKQEAKYLRLHITASQNSCAPNAYSCTGNMIAEGGNYYGGFESISYITGTGLYERKNFTTNHAATELVFGSSAGCYQDINNPYAMNSGFARDIAPHSGNYQLVVSGPAGANIKTWHKNNIPVVAGSQYRFAVWVARVDNTDPVIGLNVTAGATTTTVMSYDMFTEPIGQWRLIQGNYNVPPGTTQVSISIADSKAGGRNNYSLDDICFRECFNCGTLPLHQLELRAYLQGNNVSLKWIAENEMNTSSFIIERSMDGTNFTGIGTKFPAGPLNIPTTYQFDDNIIGLASSGLIYYRIKALDNDSRFAYSNVTTVKLGVTSGIQVWPNPAGNFVNISFSATSSTTLDISLLSSVGELVHRERYRTGRGVNQLSVNGLGSLPAGIYLIRIPDKNTGKIYTQLISK